MTTLSPIMHNPTDTPLTSGSSQVTHPSIRKGLLGTVIPYLQLMRLPQWVKNSFLFLPMFFSGEMFKIPLLIDAGLGFLAFSFVASSIYIINDFMDREADRLHPVKQYRPLAYGLVSPTSGLVLSGVCLIIGILLGLMVREKFLFVLMIYYAMNLAYSIRLKHISILDVLILSMGFVLRIKAGGVATHVAISEWLMIMVFLLSIFMAVAKRRDDLVIKQKSGLDLRPSVKGYTIEYLNMTMALLAAVIIVAYLMYTISPETVNRLKTYRLYYTTVFVLAGLLRYLQITIVENNTGSPTRLLLKDRFLQLTLLAWVASFYFILYVPDISLFK
jgi:decaprenyl-phosphate phosphoribosyltransferase